MKNPRESVLESRVAAKEIAELPSETAEREIGPDKRVPWKRLLQKSSSGKNSLGKL